MKTIVIHLKPVLNAWAFRSLFFTSILLLGFSRVIGQSCIDGANTVTTLGTIVNAYAPLLNSANSGATSIAANIDSLNNGTPLSSGSLLMIIGMQGATINTVNSSSYGDIISYNSAGKYELAYVSGVSDTATITLQSPLINSYFVGGTNRVQVVRVPQYTSLTVNTGASLTGRAWNGASGGIIAVKVCGTATVNGLIVADTIGFRGGALDSLTSDGITDFVGMTPDMGGEKGEGIAGFEIDYDSLGGRYCRGAAANGGGGGEAHNTGGGGGANGNNGLPWNGWGNPDTSGGAIWDSAWNLDETPTFALNVSSGGGRAGYSFGANYNDPTITAPGNYAWGGDDRRNVGGYGGRPLAIDADNTIFLGGGGGAGDQDNDAGTAGGRGGGIVYIVADNVTGNGLISSNGQAADTSGIGTYGDDDGPGGGGAGGTIVIQAPVVSTLTLQANGGKGGNQVVNNLESEGPGGGGGGGYVFVASGTPVITVNGGANGITTSLGAIGFPPDGATRGGSGQTGTATGIADVNNSLPSVVVYPNPTTGKLIVQCAGMQEGASARIMDMTGRTLITNYVTGNGKLIFDVQSLLSGIYLVELTQNNLSVTNKFIKAD